MNNNIVSYDITNITAPPTYSDGSSIDIIYDGNMNPRSWPYIYHSKDKNASIEIEIPTTIVKYIVIITRGEDCCGGNIGSCTLSIKKDNNIINTIQMTSSYDKDHLRQKYSIISNKLVYENLYSSSPALS